MKITFDDQFLITASEDACIIIWKICDKEGRGLKHDRDVPYAEEVLITKTDLEEKVSMQCLFAFIRLGLLHSLKILEFYCVPALTDLDFKD